MAPELLSTQDAEQGIVSVDRLKLHNGQNITDITRALPDRVIGIEPVKVRFTKLQLLSSYAGNYTQLELFKRLAGSVH
ncbi:MAG: hypothetical protein ABW080_04510 [Candidatus Thiodiazotropha sp.]